MVFTGILLDHSSLPPDFASRFVKSLALVFPWYLQAFCSITTHFSPGTEEFTILITGSRATHNMYVYTF